VESVEDILKMANIHLEGLAEVRSDYHVTLGELIEKLKEVPETLQVLFEDGTYIGEFDSYRGYYSDLAISQGENPVEAKDLLENLENKVLDKIFQGYKGGDITMSANKPLWRSEYGMASGDAVIDMSHEERGLLLRIKKVD